MCPLCPENQLHLNCECKTKNYYDHSQCTAESQQKLRKQKMQTRYLKRTQIDPRIHSHSSLQTLQIPLIREKRLRTKGLVKHSPACDPTQCHKRQLPRCLHSHNVIEVCIAVRLLRYRPTPSTPIVQRAAQWQNEGSSNL